MLLLGLQLAIMAVAALLPETRTVVYIEATLVLIIAH